MCKARPREPVRSSEVTCPVGSGLWGPQAPLTAERPRSLRETQCRQLVAGTAEPTWGLRSVPRRPPATAHGASPPLRRHVPGCGDSASSTGQSAPLPQLLLLPGAGRRNGVSRRFGEHVRPLFVNYTPPSPRPAPPVPPRPGFRGYFCGADLAGVRMCRGCVRASG